MILVKAMIVMLDKLKSEVIMFRLLSLVFITILLTGCFVNSTKFNQYIRNSIGGDFNKHYQRGLNHYQTSTITWHNKPWERKAFKWIETVEQLPNKQKQYQYQNPYSECLVAFIVDSNGIVTGAWTEGIDCGGNH